MGIIGGQLAHDPNGVAVNDGESGSGPTAPLGPAVVSAHDGGNGATAAPFPFGVPAHDVGGNGATSTPGPAGVVTH